MGSTTHVASALVISFLLVGGALADVRYVPPSGRAQAQNVSDFGYVEIYGKVTREDAKKLPALLKTAIQQSGARSNGGDPIVFVFLDSKGGELVSAMAIGRLLRDVAARTWVTENSECSSACIFILASGVERNVSPGARLGIHRPYFESDYFAGLTAKEAQTRYSALAKTSRLFLREMGMADRLFDDMLKIPSQKGRYLDSSYAEQVGLDGMDPAYDEWERARASQRLGADNLRKLDEVINCINSGGELEKCRERFWQ